MAVKPCKLLKRCMETAMDVTELYPTSNLSHANVKRLLLGRGAVDRLGTTFGRFVVTTMEVPWNLARDRLGATPEAVFDVTDMELEHVQAIEQAAPICDTVVTIGGGQAADMGKYLAWKRHLPLVNIPTIVSTNAYVTQAVGIRNQGSVVYLGDVTPELVVVDYDLVRTAPRELNIAGCGDILSIHTASFDWRLAYDAAREPLGYSDEAVRRARTLLTRLADQAEEIRALTDQGIRTIVECYLEINDICIPLGHYRAEEGPEHFFAYNVEYLTRRTFVHGWLVGLGIRLMSRLQDNDPDHIEGLMQQLDLPHSPRVNSLTRADIVEALETLRNRTEGDQRWYGVINQHQITRDFIEDVTRDLEFPE
jgi:glycerol-1-phosphate dehydrogenase [NAD(P)+]